MSWLKKIWNDSVWSKVIAALIAPYILAAVAAIKGFFSAKGYKQQLIDILNVSVSLWILPLVIILTIVIIILIKRYQEKNDIEKSVIRHTGPYITFRNQPQGQCYCAVCWDDNHKKVQLPHYAYDDFKCPKCGNTGCYDSDESEEPFENPYNY